MVNEFDIPPATTLEAANAERDAWIKTAAQYAKNADYYRGLLDEIGALLGESVRTQDDGNVLPEGEFLHSLIPPAVATLLAKHVAQPSNTPDSNAT